MKIIKITDETLKALKLYSVSIDLKMQQVADLAIKKFIKGASGSPSNASGGSARLNSQI